MLPCDFRARLLGCFVVGWLEDQVVGSVGRRVGLACWLIG